MTESIILEAARLRVEFTRHGDRFAHRVLVDDEGEQWTALLESVEGTPDDDWPPSPPWQEVHREQRGDVQLALAVGKAGSSHWSASFEMEASGRLVVDVACRVARAPLRLGNSYRVCVPARLEPPPARVMLARSWMLWPEGGVALILFDECGDAQASLTFGPIIEPGGDWPRTVRWRYTIEPMAEPPGP